MNIRQRYELSLLLEHHKLDFFDMAKELNLNVRTIRYDIDEIESFVFHITGQKNIIIKKNIAYLNLEGDQDKAIRDAISDHSFYNIKLSASERMIMILFDLCWSNQLIKIHDLCEKYFVSRATINNDILSIKQWCENNEIRFVSAKGNGIQIQATPQEQRDNLAKLVRLYENHKFDDELLLRNEIFTRWFPEIDIKKVQNIIKEAEEKYHFWFTDLAFETIAIHLAMSIKRYTNGIEVSEVDLKNKINKNSTRYKMARFMIEKINSEFGILLGETEIYYVSIHIGSKVSTKVDKKFQDFSIESYITLDLIQRVSQKYQYDFRKNSDLYHALLQHIKACKIRTQNDIIILNPLKDELIENYELLYDCVKSTVYELPYDIIIKTSDEISYLLLHFAANCVREAESEIKKANFLIVCATGIATAQLLAMRIRENFESEKIKMVAKHQIDSNFPIDEFDLIISTIPLNQKIPCIVVNPILTKENIREIRNLLEELSIYSGLPYHCEEAQMSDLAKRIKRMITKFGKAGEESNLIHDLKNLIQEQERTFQISGVKSSRKRGASKDDEHRSEIMLSDVLVKENIQLNVECRDWEDVVKKSGELLIKSGAITDEYIDEVIKNVKEVGPYIVITKGVALPHATNKVGVNKTALSLISLKNPINFGNESNDPVKISIMLATTDANSHLNALADLSEFLSREEFTSMLSHCENVDCILRYIKDNEGAGL